MIVLSLFDGMACGRVALSSMGVRVSEYWAAEIDEHAKKVARANFPGIRHLGDVRHWRAWPIKWHEVDLVMGGSPCQGFSFAGKQLAFEDPRSVLFFVYEEILNHIREHNPRVKFLLENVRMRKDSLDVVTSRMGVDPIFINSKLVSAQSRPRWYWCNWETSPPADLGVRLNDILQPPCEVHPRHLITTKHAILLRNSTDVEKGFSVIDPRKAVTMTARQFANWKGTFVRVGTVVGRRIDAQTGRRKDYDKNVPIVQLCEVSSDLKSNCLTTVQKDNVVYYGGDWIRRLTVTECERLQTLPDGYTSSVSDTQAYKMIGNGWNVWTIVHLFKQGNIGS